MKPSKSNITQVHPNGKPTKVNDSDKLKILEKQNQVLAVQNNLMRLGQQAASLQNEFNAMILEMEKTYGGKITI